LRIIAEKPWSYVLFEDGPRWLLTVLISYGAAENDMTIELSVSEIEDLRNDSNAIDALVRRICADPGNFVAREIRPAIWPK
jgi:hypothetical protein